MDTIVVIIVSVTFIAIVGSVYLEIRRQIKPRIMVYFPDGSTRASYRAKEETNVSIHIQNRGRFGFPKPVATAVSVFVFTSPNLLLKELRCGRMSDSVVKKGVSGGIFGGMHSLGIREALTLFHKEVEVITVLMQMPEATGSYSIKVPIVSNEGDLGVHELEIIVS